MLANEVNDEGLTPVSRISIMLDSKSKSLFSILWLHLLRLTVKKMFSNDTCSSRGSLGQQWGYFIR